MPEVTHIQGVSTISLQGAHRPKVHRQALSPTHGPQQTSLTDCIFTQKVYTYQAPRDMCSTLGFWTHIQHTHTHTYTHSAWAAYTHCPHSESPITRCFKAALLLSKIIVVIRSSHKGRVTDGDKSAGKKTAMHRYLKKRRANTSNLRKASHFIWEVYKKKKNTKQYLTERQ